METVSDVYRDYDVHLVFRDLDTSWRVTVTFAPHQVVNPVPPIEARELLLTKDIGVEALQQALFSEIRLVIDAAIDER